MKLKVLVDNYTYIDRYYYGEPGICFYIEDEGEGLLLDLGYSDIFLKNAKAMGIDIGDIKNIVFSHGHDDHTRGLRYYFNQYPDNIPNIFGHPKLFNKKYYKDTYIGSPFTISELTNKANLNLSKEPRMLSKNVMMLGEIPRVNDFEIERAIGRREGESGEYVVDDLIDDTALVYIGKEGLHVITGCSHSGICNIIEYAKNITGINRVVSVIGGFHLLKDNNMVDKTIEYFKENNIRELYPCHCTAFNVRAKMHNSIGIKDVGVGLSIEWI